MFTYLWNNRRCFPAFSRDWLRAWIKRVRTLPLLFVSIIRLGALRRNGSQIDGPAFIAKCIFNGKVSNLRVGQRTFIGRCILHLHDRIDIGAHVVINDGAVMLTASHDVLSKEFETTTAPISIEDYAWIATNAIVLPGSRIGRGAVVGAGAVVRGLVPDFKIAVGNPAHITERGRAQELRYDPVNGTALFEAWLGRETANKVQE